ncbi:MAG: hypothetical protein ACHQF2_01920 [Flavobacteriales bacterium]
MPFVISKEITHPFFSLWLRSDGIAQMNTADDVYFTMKETRDFLAALKEITGGTPHLILKVPGTHASLDNESRSFMATKEALQYSIAEGVVIRNLAQRILGNFYLKFDKPKKPVKLFTSIPEAEKWLHNYI